ncbi:MAG: CHASE2 domain-containing protein, partial [bacterium]
MSRTERRALGIGAGITLFVLMARLLGFGEGAALRSLDLLFWFRGPVQEQGVLAPVFIVAIDDESFDNMPEKWTWPRSYYGKIIRQIMKGKPKAIVFDMLFTEESSDARQDAEFAAACRQSGCVILGSELVTVVDKQYQKEELKLPIKVLRNVIYSSGVVNTPKDADAYVRHAALIWKVHDERHFSLALEALRKYLGVGKGEINVENGLIEFGDRKIPVDQNNHMLINFAGPAKTFRTIPFYQVFNGSFDAAVFKDAIVFVGSTAEVLHDTFETPFSWDLFGDQQVQSMPGIEIHANAIDTILRNRFVSGMPGGMVPLLILVLGLAISLVAIRARIWVAALATVTASAGVVALSIWLFSSHATFLEVVHPLGAILGAFLVCTVYRASV